jgi:hypothetical protein
MTPLTQRGKIRGTNKNTKGEIRRTHIYTKGGDQTDKYIY